MKQMKQKGSFNSFHLMINNKHRMKQMKQKISVKSA